MANLVEKINDYKINKGYDMKISQMNEIKDNSGCDFMVMANFFVFGYMQGVRAANNEFQKQPFMKKCKRSAT